MNTLTLAIPTLAALPTAARQLATALAESGCAIVAFEGEMGAGKTTLIRALCAELSQFYYELSQFYYELMASEADHDFALYFEQFLQAGIDLGGVAVLLGQVDVAHEVAGLAGHQLVVKLAQLGVAVLQVQPQ